MTIARPTSAEQTMPDRNIAQRIPTAYGPLPRRTSLTRHSTRNDLPARPIVCVHQRRFDFHACKASVTAITAYTTNSRMYSPICAPPMEAGTSFWAAVATTEIKV